MKELGLYHNDIKLENMMGKKKEDGSIKIYLIDVDTMSNDSNRDCVYSPIYSPGYLHNVLKKQMPVINNFHCNHAMDVYQFT